LYAHDDPAGVCGDFAGHYTNVHHIVQEARGGSNEIDNAIALCERCHGEAGHYNPDHDDRVRLLAGARRTTSLVREVASSVVTAPTAKTQIALDLFKPVAETYDRYARLLSFGQDERWRSFLVSRVEAAPSDRILDVACGTGAVALELVRRFGCSVVGVDQSPAMLAEARRRVARAGEATHVDLREARAEALPFNDESFEGATFTYLLRYVDDPAATLRELARVVRPGGRIASLEFFVPEGRAVNALWTAYIRGALPLLGRTISPGWHEVGRFLGPSIQAFWRRYPLGDLLALWRTAGIARVEARPLSLGGGIVVWGERGD
jgi:demethylmenaquinone methyltransferase/2-methoxy-6-polyprenyl-1,4-benzoquinol methylase